MPAVGIDLGTSNSVVAIIQNGQPVVIQSAEGNRLVPSVVAYTPTGDALVGADAKKQSILFPGTSASSFKRLIGTANKYGLGGTINKLPEELSAEVLKKLKHDAEEYLGQKVNEAVVTVPAYFNNKQREATKKAAELAGLECLRIINEPTAAALAYGITNEEDCTVLVYDLGGGTFDVSILKISGGIYEVISTCGDTQLGGDDFDDLLYHKLMEDIPEEIRSKLDPPSRARMREAATNAKIELSNKATAVVMVPYLATIDGDPYNLNTTVDRYDFNEMISPLVEKTKQYLISAMADAKISPNNIDKIILVGGSTRVPLIVENLKLWTGKTPYKGVNPDEAVAVGAAIQASVLSGESSGVILLDVTPLSLGVETKGGLASVIIPRNTTVPCSMTQNFTTAYDFQMEVSVPIFQGERARAIDNMALGHFILEGIMPAEAGVPKIDVTFNIDADGIISVQAQDLATGVMEALVIDDGLKFEENQVSKMIEDATKNKEQDEFWLTSYAQMEEARNRLKVCMIFAEQHGARLDPDILNRLNEDIATLKLCVEDKDTSLDVLCSALDSLNLVLRAAAMYLHGKVSEAK